MKIESYSQADLVKSLLDSLSGFEPNDADDILSYIKENNIQISPQDLKTLDDISFALVEVTGEPLSLKELAEIKSTLNKITNTHKITKSQVDSFSKNEQEKYLEVVNKGLAVGETYTRNATPLEKQEALKKAAKGYLTPEETKEILDLESTSLNDIYSNKSRADRYNELLHKIPDYKSKIYFSVSYTYNGKDKPETNIKHIPWK